MDLLLFLCGIALFLLGIQYLEQGLSQLGDKTLKRILSEYTRTPLQGIGVGIFASVMVQSSSIVSLVTLAFVSTGVMALYNAIGIILGANLGTTFTGWIVATIGFRLDLNQIYLPILGLGAFLLLYTKEVSKAYALGRFLLGLGLMIMGMLLMKDSVIFVIQWVDISVLKDTPLLVFFIVGAILTVVIQASSAAMMMALTALHSGIISLDSAAAFIIGADLGTTSTLIIGSLRGARIKRRVSAVHFIFNFVTDIIAVLLLPWLLMLITDFMKVSDELYALVFFHSAFNIMGILIFLPWIKGFQHLIETLIKDDNKVNRLTLETAPNLGELSLNALERDVLQLINFTATLSLARLPASYHLALDKATREALQDTDIEKEYLALQYMENQLSDYTLDLSKDPSFLNNVRIKQILVSIREALYAAKAFKDGYQDLQWLHAKDVNLTDLLQPLVTIHGTFLDQCRRLSQNPSEIYIADLKQYLKTLKQLHKQTNSKLYEAIENKSLDQEEASRCLNLNRELLLSGHCMMNSVSNLVLQEKSAQTFAEGIASQD